MIQINGKRLFFFFTLLALSASTILISPNLKQAVANEKFTSTLLTQSVTQDPYNPPPSPRIRPTSSETAPFYEQQDFWGKVAIAVISAILTLAVNYTLQALKKKDELNQQISYYIFIKKGIVEVEKDFSDKINILYNNQPIANDLYYVVCDIKNTGNLAVKDESIRFEFSKGTRFVEIFDPEAEKEMGVKEIENDPSFKLENHEKRYKISSIKRGEKISFRFVVFPTQDESITMTPHHFNGDVDFIPASIQKVEDERYQLTRFISLFILFIILPPIFEFIPFFGFLVSGATRLAILVSISPFIKTVSKILSEVILRKDYRIEDSAKNDIQVSGSGHQVIYIDKSDSSNFSIVAGRESKLGIQEKETVKDLLSQLKVAISADLHLSDEDKADALDQIITLAEATTDVTKRPSAKKALKVLKAISAGLPNTSPFVESGNRLMPRIDQLFEL